VKKTGGKRRLLYSKGSLSKKGNQPFTISGKLFGQNPEFAPKGIISQRKGRDVGGGAKTKRKKPANIESIHLKKKK